MQDILDSSEFRNQIPRLSNSASLGTLIERLTSPRINLSPGPVRNGDGSIRNRDLDNHGIGTIFEELVRRFNEEAGEHRTPRDAVRLMAELNEYGTRLITDVVTGRFDVREASTALPAVDSLSSRNAFDASS